MLSLLCHAPHLPSDIPSSSSASTSSFRANKRALAASALSVAVAGPSGNGDGQLSRHNTLKKRRHFSLSSGIILRSASRASTRTTSSSRCVSSGTGLASNNNISAPTDFRHHFHLGVEIFDNAPRDTSAWDEDKWREIIESQMNEQQQRPKAEYHQRQTEMNVASSSASSSSSSERATSPAPTTSILCPSPTPDSDFFGMSTAPASTTPRAQKRASLVRRKPVPKLCPEELALALSSSPSASTSNLGCVSAPPSSYILLPAPPMSAPLPGRFSSSLPSPPNVNVNERRGVEAQTSPRPSLSSIDSECARTSESSDSDASSSLPSTPADCRSLSAAPEMKDAQDPNPIPNSIVIEDEEDEDTPLSAVSASRQAGAAVKLTSASAVEIRMDVDASPSSSSASHSETDLSRPRRVSLPLPMLPAVVTVGATPPAVPARNRKRLSAQGMGAVSLLSSKDLPPPPERSASPPPPVPTLPADVAGNASS